MPSRPADRRETHGDDALLRAGLGIVRTGSERIRRRGFPFRVHRDHDVIAGAAIAAIGDQQHGGTALAVVERGLDLDESVLFQDLAVDLRLHPRFVGGHQPEGLAAEIDRRLALLRRSSAGGSEDGKNTEKRCHGTCTHETVPDANPRRDSHRTGCPGQPGSGATRAGKSAADPCVGIANSKSGSMRFRITPDGASPQRRAPSF